MAGSARIASPASSSIRSTDALPTMPLKDHLPAFLCPRRNTSTLTSPRGSHAALTRSAASAMGIPLLLLSVQVRGPLEPHQVVRDRIELSTFRFSVGPLPDPDLCYSCVGRRSRSAVAPASPDPACLPAARRPAAAGHRLGQPPVQLPPAARPGMTHRDERNVCW